MTVFVEHVQDSQDLFGSSPLLDKDSLDSLGLWALTTGKCVESIKEPVNT